MNDFGEYYTEQQSDGTWICAAHYDNDVIVTGESEAESLQNMMIEMHKAHAQTVAYAMKHVNIVDKARAVLADYSETIEKAQYFDNIADTGGLKEYFSLIVALADALEGGGDE